MSTFAAQTAAATTTVRTCSHCGLALTDPVSKSVGVGPICRGKENAVLAKVMPLFETGVQKYGQELVRSFVVLHPETQTELLQVVRTVLGSDRPLDLRDTVRRLDWATSFPQPKTVREALIGLIAACGYPGLAAIVSGKASTTPAKVTAEGGRIVLAGSKNGYAVQAMKGIKGWSFSGSAKTWSFPAEMIAEVKTVIATFYPVTECDLDAVGAEALAQAATLAPKVVTPAPAAPKSVPPVAAKVYGVSLTVNAKGGLVVLTPYHPGFIMDLKDAVPSKARTRNHKDSPKTWTVDAAYRSVVEALLAKHFGYAA